MVHKYPYTTNLKEKGGNVKSIKEIGVFCLEYGSENIYFVFENKIHT